MNPITHLQSWLEDEKDAGAPNPQQAVLSTVSSDAKPHSRVVAIREISQQGLVFFTQRNTRKVAELSNNTTISLVFWLELLQREVIVEGDIIPLTEAENAQYWQSYPRTAQIRFYSYAPTSSQAIASRQLLEDKKKTIEKEHQGSELPIHPLYCGFKINPIKLIFYAYLTQELSHVLEYTRVADDWCSQILSP